MTRHQDCFRMLILSFVFLLTSLSWTPRGEARPRTLSDLDPPRMQLL